MGCDLVNTHFGVIITGSFSHKSRMISKEELPEPTIIPARNTVKLKAPSESIFSTFFRDQRCLDRLSSLTIPLR